MISQKENEQLSKLLSYLLRHNPASIGLEPDEKGWVPVNDLLLKLKQNNHSISIDTLKHIVATNNKKRFAFNENGSMIRASQGHSIEVDLNYQPQVPPSSLYHGTTINNLEKILKEGLFKMSRHHVHMSADKGTAVQVGSRHGKPVVLIIDTYKMHKEGYTFFLSENGVWLTDHVPVSYISILDQSANIL